MRAPQRPRRPARLAAAGRDHAGCRHRALDGLHLVPLGQRGHGVAHGPHRGRVRACHARTFETREQASLEILGYIEAFYNRVGIHSALGNLSPAEFEARHREGAALNAA
nr:IS3 family transposase [Enorma massiliensis]